MKQTCDRNLVGWFVVFYVPLPARSFRDGSFRDPHLLSLVKDVKLGKYTVPTRNKKNPDRRVAVHYTTAAPCQLPLVTWKLGIIIIFY